MKNTNIIMLSVILLWVILGGITWTFFWFKLLDNNYITSKNKLIQLQKKIETRNKNTINKIKEIKKETELTIGEIKRLIKNSKELTKYLIIENVIDNRKVAKQLDKWVTYWKYPYAKVKKEVSLFVKNDFIVKYEIRNLIKKTTKILTLNCLIKTNRIDENELIKNYKPEEIQQLYCDNNIMSKVKNEIPFLFNKNYKNITGYSIVIRNILWNSVSIWSNPSIIRDIIKNYKTF